MITHKSDQLVWIEQQTVGSPGLKLILVLVASACSSGRPLFSLEDLARKAEIGREDLAVNLDALQAAGWLTWERLVGDPDRVRVTRVASRPRAPIGPNMTYSGG